MNTQSRNAGLEGIVGTRNWMAPEMLMGEPAAKPADVYAFGMTAYEVTSYFTSLVNKY